MDDYYLYSGASFFVKKIIEGCSEYSDYIYTTLVSNIEYFQDEIGKILDFFIGLSTYKIIDGKKCPIGI